MHVVCCGAVDAAEQRGTAGAVARQCADARRRRAGRHASLVAKLFASIEDPVGVPEHCMCCEAVERLVMPECTRETLRILPCLRISDLVAS